LSSNNSRIDPDELLNLSREMIRIPSVFSKEAEISRFIYDKLQSWGFSPKKVPVKGYGACVVAETGRPGGPAIAFNGHMDTVEVMDGWIHDPFGATIEDGLLYGLGALDMKCGLASLMVAFKAMSDSESLGGHRLVFHAVSGEEKNGSGTRALIANGDLRGTEAVIVGEGFGGMRAVTHGRRGGSYFDFDVRGKSAHGAAPHLGVNAVVDACKLVSVLERMEMKVTDGLMADDFSPLRESQTVLSIQGGGESLSVPDRCTVRIVRCTIPGGGIDLTEEMNAAVESAGLRSSVEVRFEDGVDDLYYPYQTDPESRLVKAAVDAVEHHTGKRPALVCGISEADDNIIARELGIPVICVGPGESGDLARYHKPEECITISQLPTAAGIYCSIVEKLCRV
jgi:acetylornithine deacetylase/succinyl-diaminopimelate desuccinylase-like protein